MEIKLTNLNDLDEVLKIYEIARAYMVDTNNPNQWKNTHPLKEDIIYDIQNKRHFKIENNGSIVGVFTLIYGVDETYNYIEGAWLNDNDYIVVHKLASSQKEHGILLRIINYLKQFSKDIRIDTHHENMVMQHLLAKYGFKRCGIIYLKNKEPRIAYQLHIE